LINTANDNNLKGEKTRLAQSLSYRAGSQAFESLKKNAEIVDRRAKFY